LKVFRVPAVLKYQVTDQATKVCMPGGFVGMFS